MFEPRLNLRHGSDSLNSASGLENSFYKLIAFFIDNLNDCKVLYGNHELYFHNLKDCFLRDWKFKFLDLVY